MEITKEELIKFEEEIASIFATGVIRAPVHLRSGNEQQLIDIFNQCEVSKEDWLFGYWDNHLQCLLKGVPSKKVREEILKGNSIALCFPEYNIFSSGIVGSLMGVAVGVAWSLKKQGKKGTVYHFCGDMSAETGIFFEAWKYAKNWDLPIKFIVCDNGLSVMTNTREVWGNQEPWFINDINTVRQTSYYEGNKIIYFKYENGYPHSGLGKLIKF